LLRCNTVDNIFEFFVVNKDINMLTYQVLDKGQRVTTLNHLTAWVIALPAQESWQLVKMT
jgi:hypothetical protein